MKVRSLVLAALLAALVAASAGYLIARDQVGTAQSSVVEADQVTSTDGLSVAELESLGFSKNEISRVLSWREDQATMERLEKENAPSLTVIPDPMPVSTLEWCRQETMGTTSSDVTELNERCELIELAAEGKLAGGTYTDTELAEAKRYAELAK